MKEFFTLLTVLCLVACGQIDNKKATTTKQDSAAIVTTAFVAPKDWKTFAQDNYSIQYPSAWEYKPGENGTLFILLSPIESDSDTFRENINLVTEDITGKNIDLDTYEKASLTQIQLAYKNLNIIENVKMTVGSTPYYKFHYTASIDSLHMELEQWFCIDKEKAYVLTFAVQTGKYSKFKELGENILSTFTVK